MHLRFQPILVVASAYPESHRLVRYALEGFDCGILEVHREAELLSVCETAHPHVIMFEMRTGDTHFTPDIFARIRALALMNEVYIVAFGAQWDEAMVISAIEHGADDVIFSTINDLLIRKRIGRLFKVMHHEWQISLQNAMLTHMIHAVTALNLELNVVYWNPAAEKMYGVAAKDIIGKPYTEAFTLIWESEERREQANMLVRSGGSFNGIVRHRRRDGNILDVHVTSTAIRDAHGNPSGYVMAIADVSEQMRAQRAEAEQRALAEALRESIAILTKSLNEDDILRDILSTVGKVVPHDAANIMFIEGDTARVKLAEGYTPETTEKILKFPYLISRLPIMRQVMMTGVPMIVEDIYTHPQWVRLHEISEARKGQSFLCAPIKSFEQVIGFLNLDLFDGRKFTQADAERLRSFADQVALAITNARLFETVLKDAEQVRHLQHATSLLLNNQLLTSTNLPEVCVQIARVVVEEFGALDCGVVLMDEANKTLIRYPGIVNTGQNDDHAAVESHIVAEAVRTASTIYVPDTNDHPHYLARDARTRCELVIPLISSSRILGALDVQSAEINAFKTEDRATLQAFAKHVAVVVDNILLLTEIRAVNEQLEQRVNERTSDLIRARTRVESILNSTSDALMLVSATGIIQQANPAFRAMFDIPFEAERALRDICHPDSWHTLERAFTSVLETGETARIEMVCVRNDGTTFDGDIMIAPMLRPDDESMAMVCSIRDISEQKSLSRQLETALGREHELVELKSMFIRYASHELRTPMTIIQTSADLLLMFGDRKSAEERAQKLRTIQQQVSILKDMLDKLFELNVYQQSGRVTLHPVTIDVVTLSDQIRQWAQSEFPTHEVSVTLDMSSPVVTADERAIDHILKNLILNGVKFSEPGSKVVCQLMCTREQFEIRVTDEGIGIPEEHAKHLFEPFYRIRDGVHLRYSEAVPGSGLGLTLVKQAADMHGGFVWFEPNIPRGTTFIVRIPNRDEELSRLIETH